MDVTRRDALSLVMAGLGMGALTACASNGQSANNAPTEKQDGGDTDATALTPSDPNDARFGQGFHNVRSSSDEIKPLSLMHISDVHGDGAALGRAMAWANDHEGLFDDIICTGDLADQKFDDGMDFWSKVDGARRVLTVVGNHDVIDSLETRTFYDKISVADAAGQYIEAFCDAWGPIDHPRGTTWYAKDYADQGVRLIVLDCMVYIGEHSSREADEQNKWLEATLEDARKNKLTVVIGEHFPLADKTQLDCSWSTFDRVLLSTPNLTPEIPTRVQKFIDAGGTFACYLCGHCHCDAVHTLPDHPEQFALTVPCTSDAPAQTVWGDMDRTQDATRDAFDIVFVDTANGLVKAVRIGADRDLALQKRTTLCWDYKRHRLVHAD